MEEPSETYSPRTQNVKNLISTVLKELTDQMHQLDSLAEVYKGLKSDVDLCASGIEDFKKERDLSARSREEGDGLIGKLKEETERVVMEKNENERASRIVGIELEIKELNESLKGLKGEEASMLGRIKEKEMEMNTLKKNLVEAQRVSDDLTAEIEALLKNTSALVCQTKDGLTEEVISDGKKIEEDCQAFIEELKKAFKNRDEMLDDMNQQLESLHKSVSEALDNRNFWTVLCFATTVLAAVFAGQAARGR